MFEKKNSIIFIWVTSDNSTILEIKTEKFLNIQFKIKVKPLLIDIFLGKMTFQNNKI